ncbi:MAG: tetratricopeptide repeat protein [Candidatus Omnitrophica bacterium]|nr:tetratricopeptide repeat protein [Candidatus Omnitrophota bacterium]
MQKNQPFRSKLSLRKKIALILFGLFLFLVFLEVSLRLGGFILSSIQEHRNLQSIKQKGAYRILCLGESTTGGQYPRFLEEILNQRNIGVHFSVIDKGAPGTNTSTILGKVEYYLAEYHPDMVIAMMGINDWGTLISFEAGTVSKGVLFIGSLKTYKLAKLIWLHILAKTRETGFYKVNEDRQTPGRIQAYLQGIRLQEAYAEVVSAEDAFKKAIEINPRNDNAYIELGWFYQNQGKFSLGEEAFKKGGELNPQNDNARYGLGWLYQNQGKLSLAEDAFKKAIEINPQNDKAYFGLGWVYLHQEGKLSLAEEALNKAIKINPRNDNAYIELGWLYQDQGKFSLAEEAFNKAIKINPKNGNAYLELGRLYQRQGKFSLAEDAFNKAIGINPQNDKAYGSILVLYEKMGKPELAKKYAQKFDRLRLGYCILATIENYRRLDGILRKRNIKLVCMQYPVRSVEPLKEIFPDRDGIIFIDNEKIFKDALRNSSYESLFMDSFGGDFGHCTDKGNQLLAQNIANTILKEVFNR